jgi:ABC-2 type transport system ATP-binding protein
VFGFLGPNGAGKTTTVRMLTSLIAPTGGTASVLGYQLGQRTTEIRRNVGILTETPGMYERLSAYKNHGHLCPVVRGEGCDGQVEKYLRLLGLWDRRHDAAGPLARGCGKSWPSPALCCTNRASSSWTSQRPGWTRKHRGWCAISSPM